MASGSQMVQREHGTLARTADKHQSQCPGQHHSPAQQSLLRRRERERPHVISVNQDTDEETQIGKARHDERLLRSRDGLGPRIIEPDEQVRRYPHQLPEHIHLEHVGSHHQSQHRKRKERQKRVVTLKAPFTLHIPQRVDMHHERHPAHHHQHHHADRVQQHPHVDVQTASQWQPLHFKRNLRRQHPVGIAGRREETPRRCPRSAP